MVKKLKSEMVVESDCDAEMVVKWDVDGEKTEK